jgi:signal transduction histidine kinase
VLLNTLALLGGAYVSYVLARHTLEPIEEAMEAQARFASDASHELRTPLTILRGYIEPTGRQRFEVQVSGKDRKVRPHYFSKRRHAKKYMRKQMARTEHILFKGCYPTSIVTDGEGAPTLHGLTFEYIEAVKFNG